MVPLLHIESKWQPDKVQEAILVFGAEDVAHPAVNYLYNQAGAWYLLVDGLEMHSEYELAIEQPGRFAVKNEIHPDYHLSGIL